MQTSNDRKENSGIQDELINDSTESPNNGAGQSEGSSDQQRIQYLEQSIRFLHNQHQQLVANLHDEVDQLKRKNRELQFCLVMMQQSSKADSDKTRTYADYNNPNTSVFPAAVISFDDELRMKSGNHLTQPAASYDIRETRYKEVVTEKPRDKKLDELKLQFMDEEIKHLRKQLDDEKGRVLSLTERLRVTEHQLAVERTKSVAVTHDQTKTLSSADRRRPEDSSSTSLMSATGLPFNATVEPLLVHFPPHPPRCPTLQECQAIVKFLHTMNNRQAHELNQLKTDLRDVLYSHKWTPDAYLLARAYIADDTEPLTFSLPRIPLKHTSKKLPEAAYHVKDATSFPPMRPVVGNQAIERLKKTQVLHRMKTVKQ